MAAPVTRVLVTLVGSSLIVQWLSYIEANPVTF